MINYSQIKQLFIEHNKKGNIRMSALKSGINRNTAAKYLKLKDPYHPPQVNHDWKTRKDGFSEVWPEVEKMLKAAPELQAKMLFEYFQPKHPELFIESKLRTFVVESAEGTSPPAALRTVRDSLPSYGSPHPVAW